MTDKISVLIVDDNTEYSKILHEYINKTGDMFVKGVAKDGAEAVGMIRELTPDIAILDIIMPNLDGIGVLERLSKMDAAKRPIVIMTTAIGKDKVVYKAIELGADYYIMKPYDMDILALHMRQIYSERLSRARVIKPFVRSGGETSYEGGGNSLEKIVADLIKSLGITPNISGYRYLREAVILSVNEPAMLNSLSKFVYPEIAKRNSTSARNVDRAIRCAISSACNKTKSADNGSRTTMMVAGFGRKPSNTLVIRLLTEKAINKLKTERM